jgi:acyl-CoA synthetase (AMP-forming)/AMP-acid ligase II
LFPGPVLAALREAPDRPAFEVGPRVVTRGELLATVGRLAGGLRAAGLGPGTGVGLILPLSPEAYAVHLAAHTLGCRVAPARPVWSPEQLDNGLRGNVDVVVVDKAATHLPGGLPVLSLGDLLARPADRTPAGQTPAGRTPAARTPAEPEGPAPEEIARLTFTSGSTGLPKACAHTYRAISLAYRPDRWPPPLTRLLGSFQRCLVHQSLASPVMFTYLGRCLVVGGTVVIPDGPDLAAAIERHRITATMMPPARLHTVLQSPADLGSLRAVVLGGSPAGPGLLRAATQRLGPVVWQGYGQAEAGVIAMLTPEEILAGHEHSVGRPLPAVEVRVRDGEILVRSPHMMAGYWGEPGQTAEVLRDGWLRTRDLGRLDDGGRLVLTGRARDVIMVNAEVCYAGAIERVLAGHPDVAQAYVVGASDPVTGEAVHAFVVPAGDRAPQAQALIGLVRERLSANSVPKTVTVIREVPEGAGGKPDKNALLRR